MVNSDKENKDILDPKKLEKKLKESREKYKILFEESPLSIFLMDMDGKFVDCNSSAVKIFGYTKAELIDKSFQDFSFFPSQYVSKVMNAFKTLLKGNIPDPFEVETYKKDGTLTWVLIQSSLIRLSNNTMIQIISQDINVIKRSESELKSTYSELKRTLEELKRSNKIVKERMKELNCLYGLSKILEETDITKEEILKRTLELLPLAWQFPEVACARIVVDGQEYKTENYKETNWKQSSNIIVNKEEIGVIEVIYLEEMPVFIEGPFLKEERYLIDELAMILGSYLKRKRAEQKLKDSEEKYRFLFQTSPHSIFIMDRQGKVRDLNPIAERTFQYTRKELIGRSFMKFKWFLPETMSIVVETFKTLIKGNIPDPLELQQRRKDGTYLWVYVLFSFINVGGEELIQVIVEDLSKIKEAEQRLRESEEKYRFLFETSLFSIFLLNRNGEIIDCNLSGQKTLGYPKFELIGKKPTQLSWFLSDDMTLVMENFKLLSNSITPKPFDMQLRTKDSSLIWGHIGFSFVKSDREELIQMIIQDITKNKESEQKFKKSRNEYSNLVNNISDIIFRIDLDGFIKYLSPQSYKILGYAPDELIGMNILKKIHPDDLLHVANVIREAIESKKETYAEYKYQHKIGHYIHLSSRGRLIINEGKEEITGILTDITKKKKMEIKLRESEKKYRGILENIEEGYFEIDLQGNLIFFNDSFLDLLGYSREELLGKSYREYMEEKAAGQAFEGFSYVYKTEKSLDDLQFEVIRKDGEKRFQQTSVTLIHDSRGKIIGYRGIARDVTKKKRAEELEQKFKEQLEDEVQIRTKELKIALEQQKLYLDQILQSSRFKDEFLATMSHELRTPFNAIIGFTDLLLEGAYGPLNRDQLEFVKEIKSSAEHQFEMVKDILDISKIESGTISLHLQEFSIKNIIEQIKSTLKPDYSKKDLTFEIKGLKYDKLIVADPIKLKDILINLLDNAVKYTTKGKITFVFKEDKENWIFKVKDTGIGIDKKDFDTIFKEFKRVDSEHVSSLPGTGLGLSLTKRLVALHGGTISFTSKLGVGSTFTFTIPKSLEISSVEKVEEFLEFL